MAKFDGNGYREWRVATLEPEEIIAIKRVLDGITLFTASAHMRDDAEYRAYVKALRKLDDAHTRMTAGMPGGAS